MATRESIEFDFRQAMAQADKLEDLADSLGTLAEKKLDGTLQNIRNNWTGENSTAYLTKGNTLETKIAGTSTTLAGLAGEIRTIARRVYEAEMAALDIAESRSY